jgi:hypothetical protein
MREMCAWRVHKADYYLTPVFHGLRRADAPLRSVTDPCCQTGPAEYSRPVISSATII